MRPSSKMQTKAGKGKGMGMGTRAYRFVGGHDCDAGVQMG
jgi:hypothetical protein